MLIALLVALGVDLIFIVAFAVLVCSDADAGSNGSRARLLERFESPAGISTASARSGKRGSGRWAGDVLVWNKAPLMLTNALSNRPDLR